MGGSAEGGRGGSGESVPPRTRPRAGRNRPAPHCRAGPPPRPSGGGAPISARGGPVPPGPSAGGAPAARASSPARAGAGPPRPRASSPARAGAAPPRGRVRNVIGGAVRPQPIPVPGGAGDPRSGPPRASGAGPASGPGAPDRPASPASGRPRSGGAGARDRRRHGPGDREPERAGFSRRAAMLATGRGARTIRRRTDAVPVAEETGGAGRATGDDRHTEPTLTLDQLLQPTAGPEPEHAQDRPRRTL